MIGWICPKCGKSVNPKLDHCDCNLVQPLTPYKPTEWKPYNPFETQSTSTISDTYKYRIII